MPYIIGASVVGGSSVSMDFEPGIDIVVKTRITRGPVTDEHLAALPRTLIVGNRPRNTVPAILDWNVGPFIVAPRVRDILEEIEPGRHRFVPIAIKSRVPITDKTSMGTIT